MKRVTAVFLCVFMLAALSDRRTEAAAATAVGMMATSAMPREPEQVIEFNADHPFIYCLTDDQTGVILFMGRMADPRG